MRLFNPLYDSEKVLSQLSYLSLLPVVLLHHRHMNGKNMEDAKIPCDFPSVWSYLEKLNLKKTQWGTLLQEFIAQVNQLLDLPTLRAEAAAGGDINILALKTENPAKTKLPNELVASQNILNECLKLLNEIRKVRLQWQAELGTYVDSINTLILEMQSEQKQEHHPVLKQGNIDASFTRVFRESSQAAPDITRCISLATAQQPPATVAGSLAYQTELVEKLAEDPSFKSYEEFSARQGAVLMPETLRKLYEASNTELDSRIKQNTTLIAAIKNFLESCPQPDMITLEAALNTSLATESVAHTFTSSPGEASAVTYTAKRFAPVPSFLFHKAQIGLLTTTLTESIEKLRNYFVIDGNIEPLVDIKNIFELIPDTYLKAQYIKIVAARTTKLNQDIKLYKVHSRHGQRSLDIKTQPSIATIKDNFSAFTSAVAFCGTQKAQTWEAIIRAFREYRQNIVAQLSLFISSLRDELKELLQLPHAGIKLTRYDYAGNKWLLDLLSEFYTPEERRQLRQSTDIVRPHLPQERQHLAESLTALIKHLKTLNDAKQQLERYRTLHLNALSRTQQVENYDFLVSVTQGIKYAYCELVMGNERLKETYPTLQKHDELTPVFIAFIQMLNLKTGLMDSIKKLTTANFGIRKSTPDLYIEDMGEFCRRFCGMERSGEHNSNAGEIHNMAHTTLTGIIAISRLAKMYLPAFEINARAQLK